MVTYRALVGRSPPRGPKAGTDVLPGPEDAAMASCVRHRVLDALPYGAQWLFSTAGIRGRAPAAPAVSAARRAPSAGP
ncbi:hypothetical protein [Streptomyces globisporus]|uniref:hypothetical protein n=1 Tax=Streptomyces globisporus TaxID=1908 RepID=UPI0036CFF056